MSAPKQLAKRQRLERKHRRKQESLSRRQKQQRSDGGLSNFRNPFATVVGPVGGVKMSAVLEDFVEPLLDQANGYEACSKIFSMGTVAWNAALAPESRRAAMVNSAIDTAMEGASIGDRLGCMELINNLIARKLQHFADYHRPILSFQLNELPDGQYYLTVASEVC